MIKTPVAYIIFNRPNITKKSFAVLQEISIGVFLILYGIDFSSEIKINFSALNPIATAD